MSIGGKKQCPIVRGVPAVIFIEVSSFQGVLIRGVPAVLISGSLIFSNISAIFRYMITSFRKTLFLQNLILYMYIG